MGFRRRRRIADARAAIGWQALGVDVAAGTLVKHRAGLRADLSGIAKGHGADAAARALDALGHRDYMIEVGGEVVVRGRNPEGTPWRIGIEAPDAVPQRAHTVVPLLDRAMATSGDYRIFFEQDGRRYTHEIDPATGAPVSHRLASVSVVAADCMHADAWSTALFVAGPVRGPALANELGLAAHFLTRTRRRAVRGDGHAGLCRARRQLPPPDAGTTDTMDLSALLPVFVVVALLFGAAVLAMSVGVIFKRPACAAPAAAPGHRPGWREALLRRLPQPKTHASGSGRI